MIVQIIDHEEDFIINIPNIKLYATKSGVYYVRECHKQWQNDNFNNEYLLNIKSHEECFKLPQSIQNIIYTKTQCPKEIIDRSRCYQNVI
ncbi:hypothetical protein I4U23_016267 [Adineta vaga]|nr:hypothetical protein I4U23_016267 [Adineta vaga]